MNNKIIVAVAFIGATGVIRAWTSSKPITGVMLGSFVLLFVLSIADMFGGGIAQIAGALAMIAVVYVLLTQFPWQTVLQALRGKKV